MLVVLENLMLMEKQEKRDKDNNLVLEFVCFQKGYKNLITIKHVPQDLFNSFTEGTDFDIRCSMTVWGNNNSYGVSFRFEDLV